MLDKARVDFALRSLISYLDYDLHKDLDNPEDPDGDTYPNLVEYFVSSYDSTDVAGER